MLAEKSDNVMVSVTREEVAAEPAILGLALSGGGVRAALFSLGVIIGLIETGCHRRVGCIASVSGGSILNAALAHAPSLASFSSVEQFKETASKLATSLAVRGIFAFNLRYILSLLKSLVIFTFQVILPPLIFVVVIIIPFFVGFLTEMLRKNFEIDLFASLPSDVPWHLVWQVVYWIVPPSVLLAIWSGRGLLQETLYGSVLGAVAGGSRTLNVRDWGSAPARGELRTTHVLVATDLLSGEPVYFSRDFIHCRPYGWSTPENIRTEEALYSSAAFPIVFPPKKLKTKKLKFQNGDMPGKLPRVLQLADGGIYNNLGYDWFEILNSQTRGSPAVLWPFGELKVQAAKIDKQNVIVVNAGAPSRRVRWLPPVPVARIMSVLYDNTVRPRVEFLQSQNLPVIDIEQTPIQLAESVKSEHTQAMIAKLSTKSTEFWADFSRDTAGTRTKLSPAGSRVAARLMLHGYLSSLVLLGARFGGELPERIRGEHDFLELVAAPLKGSHAVDARTPPDATTPGPPPHSSAAGHNPAEPIMVGSSRSA
jgi:predicted acylesterase/phospholipase RssA